MIPFFYILNTLIWGSTWLAIQHQVGIVPFAWSVTYRFALSALMLMIFCIFARKKMRFSWEEHRLMLLQGLLMFSLSYGLYYFGSQYLISGWVALISSTAIIMNILNARLFFNYPVQPRIIWAAVLGLIGLVIVFGDSLTGSCIQLKDTSTIKATWIGALCCLTGAYIASLGNMAAMLIKKHNLPLLQSTAYSMAYGAAMMAAFALVTKEPLIFNWTASYIISLLYLVVFGSVIAFGLYLTLLNRIGPDRAAYIFIVTPIVSLILSTLYEGFNWTMGTIAGMLLVLIGNLLVLVKKFK